ncbi:biofilm formation regulator BssR [Entomohabitans teleogrylli]|uniref:biofilm formation regulator BssR n=1 Tax=Entomohabitans teleogrylli TaxID=1384589 RepID=UPI00073D23D1|nr:biofilm formation regulator BssR [Entomohabitans teleogrylli]
MPGLYQQRLVRKMIAARCVLQNYLALRKAKGYMSVEESAALRDRLFTLCGQLREAFPAFRERLTPEQILAFQDGTGALTTVALCLMGGRRDCPQFIAVDAGKLEQQLAIVQWATDCLSGQHEVQEA